MKLVTFKQGSAALPGIWLDDARILDITAANQVDPAGVDVSSLVAFIAGGESTLAAGKRWSANVDKLSDAIVDAKSVSLLAPIPRPLKNVFCVGRNYIDHVKEGAEANKIEYNIPKAPQFFTKPPTAVIGPDADVVVPRIVTERLDYEVELAVIIGPGGSFIKPENAFTHVFGYTIINDVTGRDLQRLHDQWFKGKGLDTSCPMGPWIVTRDEIEDVGGLELTCTVNGEVRQNAKVAQMIFDIPTLLASLSAGLTLEPGDIIATGTPSGVGFAMKPPQFLKDGDVVTCTIDGIGSLTNRICTP